MHAGGWARDLLRVRAGDCERRIMSRISGCAFLTNQIPSAKQSSCRSSGDAEFREIESDFLAERLPDALAVLQQYRDEARTCEKLLDAKNVDAEQHPAGFKQLEFSLRESLRRLDDLLVTLTRDDQAPFEDARNDIDEMNRHLIHELFPRQPAPRVGYETEDLT